jgi:hypothetical protein
VNASTIHLGPRVKSAWRAIAKPKLEILGMRPFSFISACAAPQPLLVHLEEEAGREMRAASTQAALVAVAKAAPVEGPP